MPVDDVAPAELVAPSDGTAAFLDELFAKKDAYLVRDRFATIGEADDFFTKIVGVSFEGRQNLVAGLAPGDALEQHVHHRLGQPALPLQPPR